MTRYEQVLDLFAGPGGWDAGVAPLGIQPIGIEWDTDACATGRAAGHVREQADVSLLHPGDFGFIDGLIASPPCQGFSMAGKGGGRRDSKLIVGAVGDFAAGRDPRDDLVTQVEDGKSILALEPLRWALTLRPEWMCWEQVPAVLPLWEACAQALLADGYSVWTGNVHAEQYGVPQTRKRAILIASRNRGVNRPTPTHSRYYSRDKAKLDPGVLPWVSMAQALGWTGGVMRSNYGTGGDPRARGERLSDEPAPTITSKIGRNMWQLHTGLNSADCPAPTVTSQSSGWVFRNGNQPNSAVRELDEPALTVHFAQRQRMVEWRGDGESVRVTVEEAACLQSFADGYPWQGTKTAQYRQVGDAVPPQMALHVAAEATGLALPATEVAA